MRVSECKRIRIDTLLASSPRYAKTPQLGKPYLMTGGLSRRGPRGPRPATGGPHGPEEVRRAVLDAAAELFALHGVSNVPLRQIAKAADVHVSLITRYFGSREDLIHEVFDDLAGAVDRHSTENPREQHSFDKDSALGRWLAILAHWMLTGHDAQAAMGDVNPVQSMADIIVKYNGLDPREARIRSAQIFGSALGWRLFEPYLLTAGGLTDEPLSALHDELTAIHQRVGATPLTPAPHAPLEEPSR